MSTEKRTITPELLHQMLEEHERYLAFKPGAQKLLNLSDYDLRGMDFRGRVLNGAVFDRANLSNACFAGAEVRTASFREADLNHADLSNADVTYTDLRFANLSGAKVAGLQFDHARFDGATNIPEELRRRVEGTLNVEAPAAKTRRIQDIVDGSSFRPTGKNRGR